MISSPAQEGEPLQHEAARLLHALRVGAPVLQPVVGEVPQDVQTLPGGNVPVSALLDLREQPRLDQRAPAKQEVVLSEQNRRRRQSRRGRTHLATMIPDTPVSLAFMASSYDRMSPLPAGDTESERLKYILTIRRRQSIYRTAARERRAWSRCRYTPSQLTWCSAVPGICRAAAEENTFSDSSG